MHSLAPNSDCGSGMVQHTLQSLDLAHSHVHIKGIWRHISCGRGFWTFKKRAEIRIKSLRCGWHKCGELEGDDVENLHLSEMDAGLGIYQSRLLIACGTGKSAQSLLFKVIDI